jgi:predicted aspartyl protease
MMSDMGTFRIAVEIENMFRPGSRERVLAVLVDTGAELSWFPASVLDALGVVRHERRRFRTANGRIVERWVGPVFVHVLGRRATDDVVFADIGDQTLLGARSIEGLNFRVDPMAKALIDAGPADAATAHAVPVRQVTDGTDWHAYPVRPATATMM